jgi:hypothetical protein
MDSGVIDIAALSRADLQYGLDKLLK